MRAALLIFLLLVAACAPKTLGDFCSTARPARYSDKVIEAMTDAEVERTLAHNRKGAALCGWKPEP